MIASPDDQIQEVPDEGASVTDVARRYGVARQTVHGWLRRYANDGGLAGQADKSRGRSPARIRCHRRSRPGCCWIHRAHPAWRPSRIVWQLEREGREPLGPVVGLPGAVRHGLVEAKKRKRRRGDYRRWERSRSMELWQIDAMGRVHLAGGQEVKVFTGRFGRGWGR